MIYAVVALSVLLLAALLAIYHLIVQHGHLLLRVEKMERESQGQAPVHRSGFLQEGLPKGTAAADFDLPAVSGGRLQLSSWRGHEILLVFFNPRCDHSLRYLRRLRAITDSRLDEDPIPLVVSTGDADENRRIFDGRGIASRVALQEGFEVSTLYRVTGTPMGYLVGRDGNTASDLLVGSIALELASASRRSSA
jgi:peroxiredoxin